MQGKKFDVKLFYPLIIRQLQITIFQKFDTTCFFFAEGCMKVSTGGFRMMPQTRGQDSPKSEIRDNTQNPHAAKAASTEPSDWHRTLRQQPTHRESLT